MANLSTSINGNNYIAYGIGDISGTTNSLKSVQNGLTNYTLRGVVQPSGSVYTSLIGTVGSAAFTHLFTFLKLAEYYYDFATDGGAVGAIALRGPQLPATAVIVGGRWITTTTMTSGGSATIALGSRAAAINDLKTATAIATIGAVGSQALVPVMTAATDVLLTVNSSPAITVAVAALTAGKAKVVLFYVTAEADSTSVA